MVRLRRVIILGVAWALCAVPSAQSFDRTDFDTAGAFRDYALGDVNGDNALDSVATHNIGQGVAVLLGNGSGGLNPAQVSMSSLPGFKVEIADLNGDNNDDVVLGGSLLSLNFVSVLLSDGLGGFSSDTMLDAGGGNPDELLLGDLNGDSHVDLLAEINPNFSLSLLLGDGSGDFGAPALSPIVHQVCNLALADLDRDGDQDVLAANGGFFGPGRLSIRLNDGSGQLSNGGGINLPGPPTDIALGDLDQDGETDVVLLLTFLESVVFAFGNGNGGFSPPAIEVFDPGPNSLELVDIDLDGDLDLATADSGLHSVSVFLGDGVGGFGPRVSFPAPGSAFLIESGDMNADGKPDLVLGGSGLASVFLNTTPTPPQRGEGTPCDQVVMATVGVPLSIEVEFFDLDPGDDVTLSVSGLPSGATMDPPLPTVGNPVVSRFDWQPTNADAGEHELTFRAVDSSGAETTCHITVQVAECFLLLATAAGSETFSAGGASFSTQLADIFASYPVTMDEIPEFPISVPGRFRSELAGGFGIQPIAAQVVMFNPEFDQQEPERWSQPLAVWIHPKGRVLTLPFGSANGMELWTETRLDQRNRTMLAFPFTIDGL